MRSLTIYSFLLATALLALTACNPKIYLFSVDPLSTGQNDSVRVSWKVKGEAFLLISDGNHPGSGADKLHDVTLLITRDGKTAHYTLHTDSILRSSG